MGPHKSRKDLVGEYERLQHYEDACLRLIRLIESDDHLQMSDYIYKATLATLERLSDIIAFRAKERDYAIANYDPDQRNQHYDRNKRPRIDHRSRSRTT